MADEADATDFDSEPLVDEIAFSCSCKPWTIAISPIRDYFGEKVALYFQFLSFYTKHLSYMAIGAIFIQVAQDYIPNRKNAVVPNFIFVTSVLLWSTVFIENWKRQ
jgi:anoctamin-10